MADARKTMAVRMALQSLIQEMGAMNMDRARDRKRPPPDSDLGQKKDADLPDEQLPVYRGENAKRRRVRMGDPDMDNG